MDRFLPRDGARPGVAARWRDLPDAPPEAIELPPAPAPPPPPPGPTLDNAGGNWFKPAGWKPGDKYGSHRPGDPRPP